jgi:hypothetical protein
MPRFDIVVIDEPIRSLTMSAPGQFWVAPNDVRAAIDRHAPAGAYDSIICVWPTDGSFGLCGWGCSRGPTDESNGAGFSSIISDDWQAHATRLFPEEGFVHEWLHQVEAVYRGLGLTEAALPSLHDVADRTSTRARDVAPFGRDYPDYERETGSWQPWYRDYMTGTVGPKGNERAPVGLTPERWALRPNPLPSGPTESGADGLARP